ncbi:MAG: hypothetical protein K2H04_02875 [Bacteroidaceae bacterium]|nr:hypothetical protein [Bacteroidaceae bacterium]
MSPTSTNRSRGHRSVGVGDSDLVAVEAHSVTENGMDSCLPHAKLVLR